MCALVGLYLKERKREIYPAVFGNWHGLTFQVFQLDSPLEVLYCSFESFIYLCLVVYSYVPRPSHPYFFSVIIFRWLLTGPSFHKIICDIHLLTQHELPLCTRNKSGKDSCSCFTVHNNLCVTDVPNFGTEISKTQAVEIKITANKLIHMTARFWSFTPHKLNTLQIKINQTFT